MYYSYSKREVKLNFTKLNYKKNQNRNSIFDHYKYSVQVSARSFEKKVIVINGLTTSIIMNANDT